MKTVTLLKCTVLATLLAVGVPSSAAAYFTANSPAI